MTAADHAARLAAFAALHRAGDPLILWNIWDAGTARAAEAAGASAVATGSLSIAGAQGYPDGEAIPLSLLLTLAERIAASVAVPLSVDFERGYAADAPAPAQALAAAAAALAATGAVGANLEDGLPEGGTRPAAEQAARIAAFLAGAEAAGTPLLVNARTDLFLQEKDAARHAALVPEALARAREWAEAGAGCFYPIGLSDPGLVAQVVEGSPLPVNILVRGGRAEVETMAALGVARISFGPGPWRAAMAWAEAQARELTAAAPR
ncbi:2-Methylisocitrate lyase, PEP mutase family [Albimonas donghaensis]|uniref:2-Methylisocitrate lyase, PEP mutase family n=1 Tax=Albimonas donghaensis TaxID=356660 RepID=A0A1H3CB33_9RHOB|nr:isocitrate lyase/phosphoenolpyruvate mutase family protein [Albimonas donghaensis]SDX51392.1 2-Methylisocitrate lyase, PEP mutase family [Albimonas donghaensis]